VVRGIGTDILKMDHLVAEYLKPEDPFARKTYTEEELRQAALRENPLCYFATRFAGKEAVFKALNRSAENVSLNEIEILNWDSGQPYVNLHGKIEEDARKAGIEKVLISLSYDTEYAIAYAIAIGESKGEKCHE